MRKNRKPALVKPVYRFVREPEGGIRQQHNAAQTGRSFCLQLQREFPKGLHNGSLNGSVNRVAELYGEHLGLLQKAFAEAGIEVAKPSWFADLVG